MRMGILETGKPPVEMQQDYSSYTHVFATLLGDTEFTYEGWHVEGGIFPKSPAEADGWLITGSKHGAYEDHHWIPQLETFIRSCYADKVPLVGICFGHQIIAQALGGKVEKFEGGWAIGRQSYKIVDQSEPIHLNAWHQDQVTQKPEAAKVIASNEFCENAALVYGDSILTFQPHPEFDSEFVKGLLDHRAPGAVPNELIEKATDDLGKSENSDIIADQITRFLKKTP